MGLIEKLRIKQAGRSQDEFAAEIGINQSSISRILNGDRQIGVEIARKISQRYPELAFDVAAFLLGSDIPTERVDMSA